MLTEIFLVLLVLAVAALMVVDVVRTPSESPRVPTDRSGAAERPVAVPSRGPQAIAFPPERTGRVPAAPAPDPGLSQPPDSVSPDARRYLFMLAVIPAVTAAVAAVCVVRIVALLDGTSIHSQISSVHDGAVTSVLVTSAVLVIVVALGLWATFAAARSVLRRWQRPQAGAVQEAGSSDEIAGPATVFDQMRQEISRLTANEAQLRARLNILFVNLSQRSRSMVERQIRQIGNLKHGERDERRRASLAEVNRIAIHLYRNSDNLLILAGQEPSAGLNVNQPVTLTYLAEAAAAEIEEGERVSFDVQPDIAVRGPAAGDLVRVLAELIQNATSFSAADMPVHVTGRTLPTGGVLVDITDRGIGMAANEMAHANWRLEHPPATGIDVPKWMGLLVVARLAALHGIKVRLNQVESGGLAALVWLPDDVLAHQGATTSHPDGGLGGAGPAPASAQAIAQDAPAGSRLAARPRGDETGTAGMIAPPADDLVKAVAAPIYDEVESDWFRGGRQAPGSPDRAAAAVSRWSSPADQGWQAAQTVGSPSSGAPTAAGLPSRLPAANLVPGSIPGTPPAPAARSAAAARDRLAGLQRGVSEGRAGASETADPGGEGEP
jgi:signal transduction histidine kinase